MISVLIQAGVALTIIGAEYAYHRWIEDKPPKNRLPQEVTIPRCDEGSPFALFFGRVRVRQPILAWTGTPDRQTGDVANGWPAGVEFYRMSMAFVVGIPMGDGFGENKLYAMWAGDRKFGGATESATKETELTFAINSAGGISEEGFIGQNVQFYDGNASQDPAAGQLGAEQLASGVGPDQLSGYLKYFTVVLYNTGGVKWNIGSSPSVAAYSFEVSSYASSNVYPARGSQAVIGQDMNPVNILWDLLIRKHGKLGIPSTYLDMTSFQAAGQTLVSETFGLSFVFEESMSADQMIQEVLRHIDGAIDEDPATGKLVLTLVRPVDPSTLLHITRNNCDKLTNFVMSGWSALQSSLRLKWTDRSRDYNENTVIIPSQGNAVNQSETEELEVELRGIHELALATKVADREAQAWLRPIMKCSVLVGREFGNLRRGEAVKVTWSGPDLAGVVFRVANVDRGTIEDGKIRLDLISDYFYSPRGQTQEPLIDRLNDHLDDIGDFSFT